MVEWTAKKLEAIGAEIELVDLGKQTFPDGVVLPLPRAILGSLGNVSINKNRNSS